MYRADFAGRGHDVRTQEVRRADSAPRRRSAVTGEPQVIHGLEGVLAFESSVAFIDGHNGVLSFRGYDVHDFAEDATFEDVVFLVWNDRWPSAAESGAFAQELAALRGVPSQTLDSLRLLPLDRCNPMAALRTAISVLGALDPDQDSIEPDSNLAKSKSLTAKFATLVAAIHRLSQGQQPIEPDPALPFAENYLYMMTGERPDGARVRALNIALVLYSEHETNASTFATRVAISTQVDLYSAIQAGMAALKGPLHGGAIDEAMRLFMEIGSVEQARPYVDQALAARRRIPGFGHRVYRTADPRAVHLKRMAKEISDQVGDRRWYDIAVTIEDYLMEQKRLNANVDYYAAIVLYHLGFPLNLQTSFVASSRIAGWCAHAIEQYAHNRLIRPRAKFTGELGKRRDG
jgi:citrate synthase